MTGHNARTLLVVVLCLCFVVSTSIVGAEFAESRLDPSVGRLAEQQATVPPENREPVAPPADGTTVITVQKFRQNAIVAFAPDGRVKYYNDSLDRYHDVDPAPYGRQTVEFVGARYDGPTTHLLVKRVNLSTGASRTVYKHSVPRVDRPHRWHDVDRLDEHRLLIADIDHDAVFVVNTTTGERTYEWMAETNYNHSSGGPFPRDWTHLNDVERLPDGRYMASLRNQDSVVFLDPEGGLQQSWTLGTDDNHSILNEQHNPDYLRGPAVLVADSQNKRVVEYRRKCGTWVRSWTWTDREMAWPRDADRLPNGHTLIGDTNSGRVIELDENARVVWEVDGLPSYDVERLGTGDESTGGPTAEDLSLPSRGADTDSEGSVIIRRVTEAVPNKFRNTVSFVAPVWLSPSGQAAAVVGIIAGVLLFGIVTVRFLLRVYG